MKRRIGCIVLAFVLTMTLCLYGCGSKETPAEDFLYEMDDGEVTITGYKGSDREIVIPKTINDRPVTRIGDEAFREYDLVSIVIPEGVTVIDGFAFYLCTTLKQVKLPDSLQKFGLDVFVGCDSLDELVLPPDFTGFDIYQKWVSLTTSKRVLDSPVSDNTTVVVKEGSAAHKIIQEYASKDAIDGTLNYVTR